MASEIGGASMMDTSEPSTSTMGVTKKRKKRNSKVKVVCDKTNPTAEDAERVRGSRRMSKKVLKRVRKNAYKNDASDASSSNSTVEFVNLISTDDQTDDSSESQSQNKNLNEQDPDWQAAQSVDANDDSTKTNVTTGDDQSVGVQTRSKLKMSNIKKNVPEVKKGTSKAQSKHTYTEIPLLKGIINSKVRHKPDKSDTLKIMELKRAAAKKRVYAKSSDLAEIEESKVEPANEGSKKKGGKKSTKRATGKESSSSDVSSESTETSTGERAVKQVRKTKNIGKPGLLAITTGNGEDMIGTDETTNAVEIQSRRSKKKELKKALKKAPKKAHPAKKSPTPETHDDTDSPGNRSCDDMLLNIDLTRVTRNTTVQITRTFNKNATTTSNNDVNAKKTTQQKLQVKIAPQRNLRSRNLGENGTNNDNTSTAESNNTPNKDKRKKARRCRRRRKEISLTSRPDSDEEEQDVIDSWENINTDDYPRGIAIENTADKNTQSVTTRSMAVQADNDNPGPSCSYNLRATTINVRRSMLSIKQTEIKAYWCKGGQKVRESTSVTTSKEVYKSDNNDHKEHDTDEDNIDGKAKDGDDSDDDDDDDDDSSGGGDDTGNRDDNGGSNNDDPDGDEPGDDQPGDSDNESDDNDEPPDDGSDDDRQDDDGSDDDGGFNDDDNDTDQDDDDDDESDKSDFNTSSVDDTSEHSSDRSSEESSVQTEDDNSNLDRPSNANRQDDHRPVINAPARPSYKRRLNTSAYNALRVFRKGKRSKYKDNPEPIIKIGLFRGEENTFPLFGRDLMFHVRVHHSRSDKRVPDQFNCVVIVDGRMTLRALGEHLPCLLLEDCKDSTKTSIYDLNTIPSTGYFAINGIFYLDMRECPDMQIKEIAYFWASCIPITEKYDFRDMGDVRLIDLPMKLNMPYEWRHERDCVHTIIFSVRSTITRFDSVLVKHTRKRKTAMICAQCRRFAANYAVTAKRARLRSNPGYLCDLCFNIILYERGGKAVDFVAYRFPVLSLLPEKPHFENWSQIQSLVLTSEN